MKTIYFLLFFGLFSFFMRSDAQQLNIPSGITPTIDGTFSTGEWDDAAHIMIYVQQDWPIEIFFKHSNSSLFVAFTGLKCIYGERYPDILLDINKDKKNNWQTDDWWFHASYNDCEGNGIYNNWTSCVPSHPGWFANNFPLTSPGIIEIEITYAKIGLANPSNDTLGIAFVISDTYQDYHYYPNNAKIEAPSSWTEAIFSSANSISDKRVRKKEMTVFPNPTNASSTIQFENSLNEKCSLTIYNSDGKIIQCINNFKGSEVKIENTGWTKGLYFVKLQDEAGNTSKCKFIKE